MADSVLQAIFAAGRRDTARPAVCTAQPHVQFRRRITRHLFLFLLVGLLPLPLVAGEVQAQGFNLYDGYQSLPTINFASGPMVDTKTGKNFAPQIYLSMSNGSSSTRLVNQFTMDTGSTGIAATSDYYKPAPSDTPLGPGKTSYDSSGNYYQGTYYQTTVRIDQTLKDGSGGKDIATATVVVLAVDKSCNINRTPQCAPAASNALSYMGVGYNRGNFIQPPPAGSNINPFTNIVPIGQSPSTYRQGYVITNSGVTLGLSTAATQGFSAVKLTPTTPATGNPGNPAWGLQPGTVLVNNGSNTPTPGTFIPDTGISYMFINNTPANNQPSNTNLCTFTNFTQTCAANGTTVQVWLPGQTSAAASYSFTLGQSGVDNPTVPYQVQLRDSGLVNSGRTFFGGFSYFYDDVGGYVGYETNGLAGANATATPVLALTGAVPLPTGFFDNMPVVLLADTMLQQSGNATFASTLSGLGNNLFVSSGSITFNGAIDMGGGNFFVQPGASATINSSLLASSVQISSQAALTNNGLINANVLNAGTLTNAGTMTGSLTNTGTLTNIGTLTNTGTLTNSGTLTNIGMLINAGTMINSGTSQAAVGGTLVNQGTLTNTGLLSTNILNSGSLFNNGAIIGNVLTSGLLTNNGLIQGALANSGTFNGNGIVIGNFANGGVLISNGTFVGNLVNSGFLGGNPTIVGNLANTGVLSPGNSIGTITVAGNATLASGTSYNVEVNNAGQNDALSVGGTTTIQGGTVAVSPFNGVYAPRTTYTIVSSAGGLSGSFGSVSSSGSQFLLPSLSYDANNAYLTMTIGGFLAVAQNPVQAAVGGALDGSVLQASGDYAQVLGNLASSNPS
ncbi:MAG: hypothetical protein JOY64_09185, partial [Alphaproteobacteria bacterium]|nr:hypothetical protein [Alphaproteobacteria bacterium]